MNNLFSKLLYAVFPRRCDLCGDVVELDVSRCDSCKNAKRVSGEICKKCGNPRLCCDCTGNHKKPEYKSVVAPYLYDGNLIKAVYNFKFYGYKELSDGMSSEMAETVNKYYGDIDFDFITFVPLSKKRYRKRGYNQAQLLAESLSQRLNIPCVPTLKKIFETENQRSRTARQRRANLRGVFDLMDDADVDSKTILLVDDVKTTGSTLNECSAVLNAYGADKVYACTFLMTENKKIV